MGIFDRLKNDADENTDSKGFEYLDRLIHSGAKEITLDFDIELKEKRLNSEEKRYLKGILLDVDGLVIDGGGHTIDAKMKARIFYSIAENVTIKNVTLKNGASLYIDPGTMEDGAGGAIRVSEGSLNIDNVTFSDNFANRRGGAISNGGKLTVSDSTFSNNAAYDENKDYEGSGGAISGGGVISNSTFSNNFAGSDGGAISTGGILDIIDSNFSKNVSRNYGGGAIRLINCDFNIKRCRFLENEAESGGAIYESGPNPYAPVFVIHNNASNIEESLFENNSAKGEGIAIHSSEMMNLYGCEIRANASESGQIIYSKGNMKILNSKIINNESPDIIRNTDSLEIYGSIFRDNRAENIIDNSSRLSVFSCEYVNNDVEGDVINNGGEYCIIKKAVFENNLSDDYSKNITNKSELNLTGVKIKDEGKTIENKRYILIKDSSSNILDKIDGPGTVETSDDMIPKTKKFDFGYLDMLIHKGDGKEVILDEDIILERYEMDFYKGGIELDIDGLVIDGKGKTIDGAHASRIFMVTGKDITLKNLTIKNGRSRQNYNNMLNSNGAALRIVHNANLTMKNCIITDNVSEECGGAIFNNGEVKIYKSKLASNQSNNHGGCIYNAHGILNIERSTFTGNTAGTGHNRSFGGAIFNEYGTVNISKSTLLDNEAELGGAIHNFCRLNISGSVLSRNTAKSIASAILNDEGRMIITKSTISENKLNSDYSAAIYSKDRGIKKVFRFIAHEIGTRSVSNSEYFNADEIDSHTLKEVEIKGCTFKGNDHHDFEHGYLDFNLLDEYSSQLGYSVYDYVILNRKIDF